LLDHGLQAMQKIRCLLCMCCGAEDGALVALKNFEPALNIGGVVGARLRGQGKISTKESRAKLCDQLVLFRIGLPVDWKPLPATPFMAGSGGGWIVAGLVVMDR
jgi:hypothetical protein